MYSDIQEVARAAASANGGMVLVAPSLVLQSYRKQWMSAFEAAEGYVVAMRISRN